MEQCKKCENEQEHQNSKLEKLLYIISVILFLAAYLIQNEAAQIIAYLATVIIAGHEILLNGIKNVFKFNFEEDTLMAIAVVAAFILGEYPEACLVIFLFNLGEYLEQKAMKASQKSIEAIVALKENMANVVENGEIVTKNSAAVNVNEIILIKPGERVPLDCVILSGETELDEAGITGESKPVMVGENSHILSGSINLTGAIKAKVEKDLEHSMVSQIVNLVEEAGANKGKSEKFITRFSKIYTPLVIIIAIIFAIIATVFKVLPLNEAIRRSLIFLVASCPCSLVISVPLAFFSCVGAAAKKGMLIKGTKHIENLAKANLIAFDKTGTLTTGKMQIDTIEAFGEYSTEQVLLMIASLEKMSTHPIASAVMSSVNEKLLDVKEYKEIAGHGIYGVIDGKEAILGNEKLLRKYEIAQKIEADKIYLAVDSKLAGAITLKEEIRKNGKEAVKELKLIKVMLTGDNKNQAEKIAKEYEITQCYSNLLPIQKQEIIQKLKKDGNKVIFVGDGINDAPVLAEADFGISMGMGTEIANITSDAILMNNELETIPKIISLTKKTMRIVKANIFFSILVKLVVLFFGVIGIAPIWLAVFADTGVTFITVANSTRIFTFLLSLDNA